MIKFTVETQNHSRMLDITAKIRDYLHKENFQDGAVVIFCPHTTCGVTINEHADPDVAQDMLYILDTVYPWTGNYNHDEGNSAAHMKASMMGSSVTVIVENGDMQLGAWQGIFLCEFDGPRTRQVWIKTLG